MESGRDIALANAVRGVCNDGMSSETIYAELTDWIKRVHALGTVGELLGWDEQVNLPPGAAEQRAGQRRSGNFPPQAHEQRIQLRDRCPCRGQRETEGHHAQQAEQVSGPNPGQVSVPRSLAAIRGQ